MMHLGLVRSTMPVRISIIISSYVSECVFCFPCHSVSVIKMERVLQTGYATLCFLLRRADTVTLIAVKLSLSNERKRLYEHPIFHINNHARRHQAKIGIVINFTGYVLFFFLSHEQIEMDYISSPNLCPVTVMDRFRD